MYLIACCLEQDVDLELKNDPQEKKSIAMSGYPLNIHLLEPVSDQVVFH